MPEKPHIMIIEARFYGDIADALVQAATGVLEKAGATWERIAVPGVLEIPAAIGFVVNRQGQSQLRPYHGFIALGCVIRGDTSHYDIVAGESARGLMNLACRHNLAVGNGILTVNNQEQAWERADSSKRNNGGFAANACLDMIKLKYAFGFLE
ncbi:MAG: 6,7-dimethyl-8-ribityllumazine synthase [Parvularculales bacterium]